MRIALPIDEENLLGLAAMRADDFLDQGNVDGERLWLDIRRAVIALRAAADYR